MEPIQTTECNMIYRGDGADVRDLHCQRVELGEIHSFWKPSEFELAQLNAGAVIEMAVLTEPIPPIALSVRPNHAFQEVPHE